MLAVSSDFSSALTDALSAVMLEVTVPAVVGGAVDFGEGAADCRRDEVLIDRL